MTEEIKPRRCELIAQVAKKALMKYQRGEPDAPSIKEVMELCKLYEANRNLGYNRKGNPKNLKNQKPKKTLPDIDLG